MNDAQSVMIVMPEIVMAIFGMLLLVAGAFCGNRAAKQVGYLAILGFTVTAFVMLCPGRLDHLEGGSVAAFGFHNMFVDDGFARFMKMLMLIAAGGSIMLSWSYMKQENLERFEYPVLILFATLGMMLMVSASDMLSLYVGLELQSLPLYVLAAFRRDDARSSEAGLKYFVLGALSSGLILYGISLIYGYAGTTDFVNLGYALREAAPPPIGILIGMVFICAALAFKVAAVPFHMWTPDVYEGAPTPVTAFFASAPKLAALALLVRLLMQPFSGMIHQWEQIIVFISVASMVLGCFAGLVQSNIKRLLAYSSIANIGFALAGLAAESKPGILGLLIYLAVYFANTLGAFGVVLCLRKNGKMVEKVDDLAGLAKSNPVLALAMAIFMFSMAGVPPFAGFFGKYFVFLAAAQSHLMPLAIIGLLSSVVSAFYYLRVIKVMYFDELREPIDPLPDWGVKTVITLGAVYMLLFTISPAAIIGHASEAVRSFLGG
ncbi:MAG TPA: NADH-quinone oxidoreductase subunit NuoN [Alphaproteobacteria bacterium]|nr:NADH-quinone oxidoreductase subunit NuoN [Alphaproteobacteria bacterium]